MSHPKFPTQIARVEKFLDAARQSNDADVACNLGYGPNPFTEMLVRRGYRVVAADFSGRSLSINRDSLPAGDRAAVTYVRADLNRLRMAPRCAGLLLMCDFLQHLGDRPTRDAFLAKAFEWLRPGGRFYLTFFNVNVKNVLKGDLRGTFAGGAIRYERLRHKDVLNALPAGISVDAMTPLNIFQGAAADGIASTLPGSRLLARMIALSGSKT